MIDRFGKRVRVGDVIVSPFTRGKPTVIVHIRSDGLIARIETEYGPEWLLSRDITRV